MVSRKDAGVVTAPTCAAKSDAVPAFAKATARQAGGAPGGWSALPSFRRKRRESSTVAASSATVLRPVCIDTILSASWKVQVRRPTAQA